MLNSQTQFLCQTTAQVHISALLVVTSNNTKTKSYKDCPQEIYCMGWGGARGS